MKRLQEHTMTKMAVLGKGSMRDKQKVCKVHRAKRLHAAWFVGAENRFSAPRTHKIEVKTATFFVMWAPT